MREIWGGALSEFFDALAHSMAALFGERLSDADSYRRYRLRNRTYLIRKD